MLYSPHCWPQHRSWHFNHCSSSPTFQAVFYLFSCPPIQTVKRLAGVNHIHCSLSTNPVGQALFATGWPVLTGPIHPYHVHMHRNVFQEYLVHAPVHADLLQNSCVWLMASWLWARSTHNLKLSSSIRTFLLLSVLNIFRSLTFCYMNFVIGAQDFIEFADKELSREGFFLSFPFSAC